MKVKKWELMKHQKDAVEKIFENYNIGNNTVVYTSGVGTGKTSVFCGVAREIKGRILYVIPKKAIIANVLSNKMFKQEHLESRTDFITFNYFSDLSKGEKLDEYELIVIDEAHHIGSDLYGRNLIECLKQRNIKTLGLTATPERMDALNVTTLFKATVNGLTNFEAITNGLMPRIEYLVCIPEEEVDLSFVVIDWENSYKLLKKAIHENPKDKWICFFSKISELKAIKPYIKSIFPNYETLEIHSNSGNTQEILDRANKTDKCVMLNCDMLLEGLHFDNVDGIILFRNVHSVPVFEQIIGRVSAMFKTEDPLVIDCTDTWLRMDRYIEFEPTYNHNEFSDFDKNKKDKFNDFHDIANGNKIFKTPCYVSLKNKKYYDYMAFLRKKHDKSKYQSVVYKGVEYKSKIDCCRTFNQSYDKVRYYESRYNISFEQALDKAISKQNQVYYNGEYYRSWSEVCKKYNISLTSVITYKDKNSSTYEEAIYHIVNHKRKQQSWTEEEKKIMFKRYPKEGINVIKLLPNRTPEQIRSYASYNKIKRIKTYNKGRNGKRWTDEEVGILQEYYPLEGLEVTKRLKNRSLEQCRCKAYRLRLKILK